MALIGWQNAVETASTTLAASSAADGFSAELLRVPVGNAAAAWQTAAGVTSASLTITATAAVAWRAVALCRTNLTTAATLRVRVGTAANVVSAPAYDGGVLSAGVAVGIRQGLHVMPSAVSAVCMRLDIADPTNPDGYLNIPLIYAGPGVEFSIAPSSDDGDDIRREDVQTRSGAVITTALSRARNWSVRVPFIRRADADWIDPVKAAAAAGINALFVPLVGDTRAPAETIFGLMTPARRGFPGQTAAYRSFAFTISERL